MPIPERFVPIIELLEQVTAARTVKWTSTTNADEFVVALPQFSVRISRRTRKRARTLGTSFSLAMGLDVKDSLYTLTVGVLDAAGDCIDDFALDEGDVAWPRVDLLYHSARRQARGSDEALKALAEQLRSALPNRSAPVALPAPDVKGESGTSEKEDSRPSEA